MFINKDSIKLNNISMGNYLLEAKYQYPKLWGDDTGRNLAGSFTGTLLGVFPKLVLQFKKLSQQELELLAPIFDSASQQLTYYDPVKRADITITTYSGDWEIIYKGINHPEAVQISFIDTCKRS